jgi:hypothetical protein
MVRFGFYEVLKVFEVIKIVGVRAELAFLGVGRKRYRGLPTILVGKLRLPDAVG